MKPIGEGIYFAGQGRSLFLLLCGGDKTTQNDDIARAKALAREWKDGA